MLLASAVIWTLLIQGPYFTNLVPMLDEQTCTQRAGEINDKYKAENTQNLNHADCIRSSDTNVSWTLSIKTPDYSKTIQIGDQDSCNKVASETNDRFKAQGNAETHHADCIISSAPNTPKIST